MSGVVIESADDLFAFICFAQNEPLLWKLVDTEKLRLQVPVVVKGEKRDGRIGVDGAKFIQNLDKQLQESCKLAGAAPFAASDAQLRVQIKKGSDSNLFDYTKIALEALSRMEPIQITFVVALAIVCGCGLYAYNRHRYYTNQERMEDMRQKIELARLQQNQQAIQAVQLTAKDALDSGLRYLSAISQDQMSAGHDPFMPIRGYAKKMGNEESISVNDGEFMSKAEALEKLDKVVRDETVYFVHADGEYVLTGVSLLAGRQALQLSQGGQKITGLLERLDDKLKSEILLAVDESMETKKPVTRNLHLDVYFSGTKVHGTILGAGSPRLDLRHYKLREIPDDVPRQHWMRQGL